jgi:hypothetical protein
MTSQAGRLSWIAAALALVAAPGLAEDGVGIDISVHGGVDKYGAVDLKTGLSTFDFTDAQRMRDASATLGATAIVRLGLLEVGALAEAGRPGRDNTTTAIAALGGLGLGLGRLHLDALGELGGHRYADALTNPSVIVDTNRSDWLAYVGVRPGISLRLGERGGIILGLWGYARRDVTRKDIPVTLADLSGMGAYDLGGTQVGLALRLGFAL